MPADFPSLAGSPPATGFWNRFRQLLELIRFSHTVFALPFALLTALLAWRKTGFQLQQLLGLLLCMVFARSAAMAFNRLVDREFDAHNPRTQGRHLPSGQLTVWQVRLFVALTGLGFILSTLLFLPNIWPVALSGPVLAFLCGYSLAKRFTSLCHYWLSAALMLSPIATWLAITGAIDPPPLWLAAMIFFWVGGFDILYACQDVEIDRQLGLHSLPARWGVRRALRIAVVSHLVTIACLFGFWHSAGLGPFFFTGSLIVSSLLLYEHWLVRPNDLRRVNEAFFNINALISLGLLAAGAVDLWLQ